MKSVKRINIYGTEIWHVEGKEHFYHREDGPAIVFSDGTKYWYKHGMNHREDGPAITDADGHQQWWIDGARHKEDGPAIINADGTEEWWIRGEKLTEEEIWVRLSTGKKIEKLFRGN